MNRGDEDHMTKEQLAFFNELKNIQELVINISFSNSEKYESREDIIKDVTYEVIYRIMELLDGYRSNSIKYSVVNTKTGETINEDIEMHDLCEEFLKCTNI